MNGMRKFERYNWFSMISNANDNSNRPLGFTINISEDGICLWIRRSLDLNEFFLSIKVAPPSEIIFKDSLILNLTKIWIEETKIETFIKVGCQFVNLNNNQKNHLEKLINFVKQNEQLVRVYKNTHL